jgi:hypothetical protein
MATLLGARMDVQSRAVRHAAGGKPKSLKCAGPQRRGISHKSAGVLEVLCVQGLPHAGGPITFDTNDEMGPDWHGFSRAKEIRETSRFDQPCRWSPT